MADSPTCENVRIVRDVPPQWLEVVRDMRTTPLWRDHAMAVGIFALVSDLAAKEKLAGVFMAAMRRDVEINVAARLLWDACVECMRQDTGPHARMVRLTEMMERL